MVKFSEMSLVWQSLAVVLLVSAVDSPSLAGFWQHYNVATEARARLGYYL